MIGKEKGDSRLSVQIFCLTVANHFLEQHFCVAFQKIFGSEKVYGQEGGYQDFPSKIFCLTVLKTFVGESFSVSLISGIEKVYG